MKKFIYGVMLLCAASLFMVSCGDPQQENPKDGVTITINPATMKLAAGEQSPRLAYTVTPTGTKVQISWASENEEVATVNAQGVVTGINNGTTNIICTDAISGAKGTCVVTVASLVENLDFTEAYLGYRTHKDPVTGKDVPDIDSTVVKYYVKQFCEQLGVDSLNAYIAMLRVQLFSGLYFNAGGTLDGAEGGGYIIGYAPTVLVSKEANPAAPGHTGLEADVVFSLGGFAVDTEAEPKKQHHMQIGQLNNDTMMYYLPKFFADYNANHKLTQEGYNFLAYGQIYSVTGTKLLLMAYDAEEGQYASYPTWLWQYFPNAIITGGEFYVGEKQGSSKYMYQIDYIDLSAREVLTDEFGIPGVFTDLSDTTQVKMKSTSWELGQEFKYEGGVKPEGVQKDQFGFTVLKNPIVMPAVDEILDPQAAFEKFMKK